eukprot:320480-Ditylum_brightwellii.AAC.1
MERREQNKHIVCNKDNDVDNDVDNDDDDSVDDGVDNAVTNGDDGVDDCDDSANKHLTHLSQAADCCLMKRSK